MGKAGDFIKRKAGDVKDWFKNKFGRDVGPKDSDDAGSPSSLVPVAEANAEAWSACRFCKLRLQLSIAFKIPTGYDFSVTLWCLGTTRIHISVYFQVSDRRSYRSCIRYSLVVLI